MAAFDEKYSKSALLAAKLGSSFYDAETVNHITEDLSTSIEKDLEVVDAALSTLSQALETSQENIDNQLSSIGNDFDSKLSGKVDLSAVLTKTQISNDYCTKDYLSTNYYTKNYINTNCATKTQLSANYYEKTRVDNKIANLSTALTGAFHSDILSLSSRVESLSASLGNTNAAVSNLQTIDGEIQLRLALVQSNVKSLDGQLSNKVDLSALNNYYTTNQINSFINNLHLSVMRNYETKADKSELSGFVPLSSYTALENRVTELEDQLGTALSALQRLNEIMSTQQSTVVDGGEIAQIG